MTTSWCPRYAPPSQTDGGDVPEGPEIRRAADRIAKIIAGQFIERAQFGLRRLRRFEQRLAGRRVVAVETRGKAMLTRFEGDLTLYSHNQLYGRWYAMRRPKQPRTKRQLRVALHTHLHSALLYSASDIDVLTGRQLDRHPFLVRLGPDILDPALTPEGIVERLESSAFRNRALGGLFLDQSFLAGNGNYLRSEILWAARVHAAARPADLDAAVLGRVARETLRISRRSYRTRGVTAPDRLARSLKAEGESYEQYRFMVYGREGLPCRACGSVIQRHTVGSRSLFRCPGCQPD